MFRNVQREAGGMRTKTKENEKTLITMRQLCRDDED